jgi:tetratricopeptide (TPR) repeat protein
VAEAPAAPTKAVNETVLRDAVRLQGMGLAKMAEGNYAEAITHYQEIARILPDNVLPAVNLAICRFLAGDPDAALQDVRRGRELAPDNPQILFTLAKILGEREGARQEWESVLTRFAKILPHDPRPWYLRAQRMEDAGQAGEGVAHWRSAQQRAPDNLVLMVGLLRAAAAAGDLEGTSDALYAIEDRLGGFEEPLADFARKLREAVDREDADALAVPAVVVQNILRPEVLYQIDLDFLTGRRQPAAQLFPQLDFLPPLPPSVQGGADIEIAFADATDKTKLTAVPPGALLRRARVPGRDHLLASGGDAAGILELADGTFRWRDVGAAAGELALRLDVDQDGINDVVSVSGEDGVLLYPGASEDKLRQPLTLLAPEKALGVVQLLPVDLDHEGDLDLLLLREAASDLYLRQNGDGSWTEMAGQTGIAGPAVDSTAAATADFDDDGDLDLLVCHGDAPPRLYLNRRGGKLDDATEGYRLDMVTGAWHVQAADLTNDGLTDLLFWGPGGGQLWTNQPTGEFAPSPLPAAVEGVPWTCAEVADYDNDGDQDVAACLNEDDGPQLAFLRNRKGALELDDASLPALPGRRMLSGDLDADGDLDLMLVQADGSRRYLRNDGGNRNHFLRLTLRGKNDNNAKNNTQGLFTRIETRVSGHYQAVLGHGGVNHLGLGARRQAEILRVVWTNGLPQTWQLTAADQVLDEEQVLKGSCPFLYAWNGTRFEFVTDLMWKSPLGMFLDNGAPAPHQSARDFVRIPGEALQPRAGSLWLQITEELWETIYIDRLRLHAVDHPAEVELVIDEKFYPPPYPTQAPIHWVSRRLSPVAAVDHQGRDVRGLLEARDGRRVDGLPLTRYQGMTAGHHVEVTFDGVPAGGRLRLILHGWIFPTDTSINTALSQNPALAQQPPRLELQQPDGTWKTLVPFLGFPAGKNKDVVTELTGMLPPGTVNLRLSSNMRIYWDAAWLAVGEPEVPAVVTALEASFSNLHYRGFSAPAPRSLSEPHLFDYARVSTGPRFRDMGGQFTRFGEVDSLLTDEDDRYVVMNAGDELSVRFDAGGLPPLRDGWRRDYILYTDGWVKDADINTAHSGTVEPLPYHGMEAYPDQPSHGYPDTLEHREYRARYQTRRVTDRPFRDALKQEAP